MELKPFVTARIDRVFKAVFLDEKDLSLLEGFLSFLLHKDVKVLELLREGLNVTNTKEKSKTVDALIELDGELVHIELNTKTDNVLKFRNYVFFSKVISNSVLRSESYDTKIKYIHIDFSYKLGLEGDYVREYKIQDDKGNLYVENIKIFEYNMDKYMKYWKENDLKNIKKYLPLIMLDLDKEELKRMANENELVKKYSDKIIDLNDKDWFSSFVTEEEDERFLINTYKRIARDEGKTEGIEIGKTEGIEIGKTEGKKEQQLEIAKNALLNGLSEEQVATITNMNLEEVKALKDNLEKDV